MENMNPAQAFGAALLLVVTAAAAAFAAGAAPEAPAIIPEGMVPAWVVYSMAGVGTSVGGAMIGVMRMLWNRMAQRDDESKAHYEGTRENPDRGAMPRLRLACEAEKAELRYHCEAEKAELRSQVEQWRVKFEVSESERRSDTERFRLSELENLRSGMETLQGVGSALQENTKEIQALTLEIRQGYDVETEET